MKKLTFNHHNLKFWFTTSTWVVIVQNKMSNSDTSIAELQQPSICTIELSALS